MGYRVTIVNNSSETVQLCSRYWQITDANGHVQEVRGSGVVGKQPVLDPGDSYQYSSGCPLTTSSGVMVGRYQMKAKTAHNSRSRFPPFHSTYPNSAAR
ncbi:protein apaG [Brucella melitensis]|nr:protein apaG [Brucella melitensis]